MNLLKKLFVENTGWKIVSVLFATALWFFVTNYNDPITSETYANIPVNILNADILEKEGKIYEVLDKTNVISSVTVRAPRSIIDSISAANISATADMNNLTGLNTLPIDLRINKYAGQIQEIRGSVDTVRLMIDDLKGRSIRLEAEVLGTVQEGCKIASVNTDYNVVRIEGPASVVDQVDKASVVVDVTGFAADFDTRDDIRLYDANGEQISTDSLKMSITNARIEVSILQTKRVDLRARITGIPAEGYVYTGRVEIVPDNVLLAGKASVLQNMEELTISDAVLDVTGLTEDLNTGINIKAQLPSGITLGDDSFNGQITVTAGVERETTRRIEIEASGIEILNVPAGMRANIQTQDLDEDGRGDGIVYVTVGGLKDEVTALDPATVTASVDLSELTEKLGVDKPANGSYNVAVTVRAPGSIRQKDGDKVYIYLEEEE
ncbi:MAG: hypothetical protein IKO80_01215 [Lachnospiraceae bacterium]|nr:hypothetical protein [Lachnospiraceae bacterium]